MKANKILKTAMMMALSAGLLLSSVAYAAEPPADDPPAAPPAVMDAKGTIQILRMVNDKAIEGTEVSIYRVADLTAGVPAWTEEYAEYQLTLKPNDETSFSVLPQNLVTVIQRDKKEPVGTKKTGADGKAMFDELDDGVYLVTGARYQSSGYYYDPIPFLVFLPYLTAEQTADRTIDIEMKHTATRVPSSGGGGSYTPTISRKVLKVWDDETNEGERPDHVTVQLLNGDKVVDTQALSAANSWRFTWTNLSQDGDWAVAEVDVPEDYSASVRIEGVTFVVTNTFEEDLDENKTPQTEKPEESPKPEPEESTPPQETVPPQETPIPDDEHPTPDEDTIMDENPPKTGLPQTGQLWEPVLICSGLGIAFVLAGLILKRKEQDNAEIG